MVELFFFLEDVFGGLIVDELGKEFFFFVVEVDFVDVFLEMLFLVQVVEEVFDFLFFLVMILVIIFQVEVEVVVVLVFFVECIYEWWVMFRE